MVWVATAVGVGTTLLGGSQRASSERANRDMQERQLAQSRGDLAPYREFGGEQLAGFQNWLASPEGQYQDPTMEDVLNRPGYQTRLGAIENSAAARGGLLSGNALRSIGEFGANEFDRARNRTRADYADEYNRRMGRVNIGYGAAGGSAGFTSAATQGLSGSYDRQGQAQGNMYNDIGSTVAGGLGARQGRQQWDEYLNRAFGDNSVATDYGGND